MKFPWTPDLEKEAMRLYDEGKFMRDIANVIGCSRNSVIGKIHRIQQRLGLRARVPKSTTVEKGKYTKRFAKPTLAASSGKILRPVTPAPPQPPMGNIASIVDVIGCRFPVIEDRKLPGGHGFCNAEKAGPTYCAYHMHIARRPKGVAA